jgi:hypothetical protein
VSSGAPVPGSTVQGGSEINTLNNNKEKDFLFLTSGEIFKKKWKENR